MDPIDAFIERHGAAAVTAALLPLVTDERIARIDRVLAARLQSVAAIVEDTYDPHNAAATIRTCEALGLQDLHVVAASERFAAAKGVTRGAHQWIDVHDWARPEDAAAALHARGARIYAAMPGATASVASRNPRVASSTAALSIDEVDVTAPIAVMFGNEHAGLSDAAVRACDATVAVPMFGFTESFNLSVTVALATSRLAARRRAQLGATGDLDDARRVHLRARWLAASVRAAELVLARAFS